MTRSLRYVAFFLGLGAICWVGAGYIGVNTPALLITTLIGSFYLMGGWELNRFQQATDSLARALAELGSPPADLNDWLTRLHPSLQNVVRLRVEGERVGLPGPSLTPYLAGLLVLLGMLGTFLGMVVTLNGTGSALESASDIQSIRASLAAPVKGLGLAFGTSLAGVAASAVLGLVSALCRRDRLQAAQVLDGRTASTLRIFSRAHQREQSFKLLELQSQAMPALVDRLGQMMGALEHQSQALNERLVASQDAFHRQAQAAYSGLAQSVGQSLQASLAESARVAGATIQPIAEATMAAIAREASALHDSLRHGAQQQLDGLATRLEASTTVVSGIWRDALTDQQRSSDALAASLQARDQERLAAWTHTLQSMADSLAQEWQQAGALAEQQSREVCKTLADTATGISAQAGTHARDTIAEIARLVDAAADAPRAAAEVVGELRAKVADSIARDNVMIEERGRLLAALATAVDGVNDSSNRQRSAVDALVASSSAVLDQVAARFAEHVHGETLKIGTATAQVAGSAIEVASWGESFGTAVQLFSDSNDKLAAQLQRIEAALGQTATRSDEQLAYYVAQAREVVDLSVLSQRQVIEELQQLTRQRQPAASGA